MKISSPDEGSRIIFLDDSVSTQRSFSCFEFSRPQKNVIPAPAKVLINRLAELGQLYGRVDSFIRQRESVAEVGMIEQSLCHHLQAQLTEYYRLIAVLETHMSQDDNLQASAERAKNNSGLSLRRLDVWINEWRMRMQVMSVCVEGAKSMLILSLSDHLLTSSRRSSRGGSRKSYTLLYQ